MPPAIALLFCVIFIIALFLIDIKRNPMNSSALWVPVIWLILVGSRSIPQWLSSLGEGSIQGDNISGNIIDQITTAIFIIVCFLILFKRKIFWAQILKNNGWIIFWFFLCGISILWSDYPEVSLRKWIKGFVTLLIVLTVVSEADPFEAVKTLFKRCAYVLIPLSYVLIRYYPHIGIGWTEWGQEAIIGASVGKNGLGRLCMVSGFFFVWDIVSRWQNEDGKSFSRVLFVDIIFFLMILRLLLKSNSATSLAVFGIGVCVFTGLGLSIVRRNVSSIGVVIFISCLILILTELLFGVSELLVTSLGRNMTLTERTFLWRDLIDMNTDPFFGTGYDSFWLGERQMIIEAKQGWLPTQAHNGYLEVYLELGLVGLIFFTLVIFGSYWKICKVMMLDFDYGRGRMALLIMFLLYNFTESAVKEIHMMWFVFLLISVDYSQQIQSKGDIIKTA